jgi:ethanolamine ammonia-lyase small subunit
LREDVQAWSLAPVVRVEQGRVAIGDPVGAALKAKTLNALTLGHTFTQHC